MAPAAAWFEKTCDTTGHVPLTWSTGRHGLTLVTTP